MANYKNILPSSNGLYIMALFSRAGLFVSRIWREKSLDEETENSREVAQTSGQIAIVATVFGAVHTLRCLLLLARAAPRVLGRAR